MKVTRFDTSRDLIVVDVRVWGPRRHLDLSLAVDTASSATVLSPDAMDDLGYSPRDGEQITTVRSAIGKEQGYTLSVERFRALGFVEAAYRIHVFDLATGHDIDGLLGLSFLKSFNLEIRFAEGRIVADRVVA